MATLHEEISEVLDRLCDCWNRTKLAGIEALWDKEEAEPFVVPQEVAQPVIGWRDFRHYLQTAEARLHRSSMRYWDLKTKPLGKDLAVAVYQMHWNGLIKGFSSPVGVDTRVTVTFRRRSGQFFICHYVEAPTAFLLFLNKVYAAAVDADFDVAVPSCSVD